jgi:hypothetical protein
MTDDRDTDRALAEALAARIEAAGGVVIENGAVMVDRAIMRQTMASFVDELCADIRRAVTSAVASNPETAAAASREIDAAARRIEQGLAELVPQIY